MTNKKADSSPDKSQSETPNKKKTNKSSRGSKSKKIHPNSLRNLIQYRDPEDETFIPEIVDQAEGEDEEIKRQVETIVKGGKGISSRVVRKLIPKRNVLTPAEKERYAGVVATFLSDFKNDQPTASDIDDILEIAKCDIMETRLLEASRSDPATLVSVSQALDRIYKRKQQAKENLAARRIDRRGGRSGEDISIVDLVAAYERHREKLEEERVAQLLAREKQVKERLRELIKDEEY